MSTISLCLASASSARLRLLERAGVTPLVRVSEVDEDAVVAEATGRFGDLAAEDVALLLARAKCEDVAATVEDDGFDGLVLGCDSVLEIEGQVYGKPGTPEAARDRWTRMGGRSGVLHTGHWIIDAREDGTNATFGAVASTTVHFAELSPEEIDAYVATEEPLFAAGAFTIDGLGAPYISGIEGDHNNVIGLGLPLVREMLAELDIRWHDLRG